ncbi:MAG: NAD(P)/FAD-dependent oxidoreductase [Devosia sp.]|nr:NAD(P)/FAD-dependent oxidoreductase [Devosia sp.]
MAEFLTPDICVIGGGAGGLATATRARALGASVVLIEKGPLGGASLNSAALPSKALAAAARRAHDLSTAAPFGIANAEPRINARGVFDHVHAVVEGIAPTASPEHLLALGVELLGGEGRFVDKRTVAVGDRLIRARHFVIATGSRPWVPEIAGLDSVPFFTSSTIFDNPRKLTHLVIIGGGPVGIELAQAFRRLGSDVTVVEIGAPLADCDPELADIALRLLAEEGVVVRPDTEVVAVQQRSLGIGVTVRRGAVEEVLDASHILVAAGRLPNLDGLDLAKAGIRRRKKGTPFLALKPNLRTSNPQVYAIGDAAGGAQHTHAATHQAELVLRNALLGRPVRYYPYSVPYAIFTDPEIAEVGVTEPEAKRGRKDYRVHRFSFTENDRARAERRTHGLVKVVTNGRGRLLGAGIVGTGAAEMIALFGFAIGNGLSIRHFGNFVAPYPTLSEVLHGLAEQAARAELDSALTRRLLALRRVLPWP